MFLFKNNDILRTISRISILFPFLWTFWKTRTHFWNYDFFSQIPNIFWKMNNFLNCEHFMKIHIFLETFEYFLKTRICFKIRNCFCYRKNMQIFLKMFMSYYLKWSNFLPVSLVPMIPMMWFSGQVCGVFQ